MQVVDVSDGFTYNMDPEALVAAREDTMADEVDVTTSTRLKALSQITVDNAAEPASPNKRTAPAGTNASKSAKKNKTSASASQVWTE